MRVVIQIGKDGQPIPPGQGDPKHDHHNHHDHGSLGKRCVSPLFGGYVAAGCVAVGWAGWKLLAAVVL